MAAVIAAAKLWKNNELVNLFVIFPTVVSAQLKDFHNC